MKRLPRVHSSARINIRTCVGKLHLSPTIDPALDARVAALPFASMPSRVATASGDSTSSEVANPSSASPRQSQVGGIESKTPGPSRPLFHLGSRSLHSMRRLKELEESDATLGFARETSPSRCLPCSSTGPTATSEGPQEVVGDASESEDDTLEVVRSMKDLQRIRRGPRKGLDIRVGLEETLEANDEEEREDAVGLLEKNFASGGPGSAADRHL